MSSSLVGKIIADQFRVDAFLDAGGMGSVYRVWDKKRNQSLAMKVLHADLAEDSAMFERFKREARALRKLKHPNIVPFYGLYDTGNLFFLLERFIDGPNLKEILSQKQGEPLSDRDTLIVIKALCSAIGFAHNNNVIHCDVKTANVMTDRGGNIYLGDFGIARHADSNITAMAGAGTPAYMAPEQILNQSVNSATDIYALGVLLFEMTTGQRPFRGIENSIENTGNTINERILYAHLNLIPPNPRLLNPRINDQLAAVILRALEKDVSRRYQSCREFFDAICQAYEISPDLIADRMEVSKVNELESKINPPGKNLHIVIPTRKKIWVFAVMGSVALILLILTLSGRISPPPVLPTRIEPSLEITEVFYPAATERIISPIAPTIKSIPTQKNALTNTTRSYNSCPDAKPQRVIIGDKIRVCTKSDRVIVRSDPEPGDNERFRIYPGTEVEIIGGPQCGDGSSWWYVLVEKGTNVFNGYDFNLEQDREGWIREGGDNVDQYYICRVN